MRKLYKEVAVDELTLITAVVTVGLHQLPVSW
jgi:hypothetical protein